MAIDEAWKSVAEDDGRAHPRVGPVVVKDGKVLAVAHRGEMASGNHAEFVALEKKLAEVPLAGATVYTTLEP
jgi:pyrimidine deaminase RibD-like protein